MKFLIWLGLAFVFALLTAICNSAGITIGGIPTLLIAGVLIYTATSLCKKWDKAHKSSSRTTTEHHKFAYPETSKDRLAKAYNHRILQEINNLTSDNAFPGDLTSRLLLYFSGMELIQDAVGKLDLVESMARNLTITLNQDYNYSPQYIKESLNAAFGIFYEKKMLIDSFLDAEFLIDPSEIYKDERYIVRYAEHIMFVIFAMPYNKDISDALIDSYHNISELQNDYVESKTTIQHNPQVQSTSSFHQTSPQPPQPNTPPPQQAQLKPLKSDKTFWRMLVIFGVLPLIFVLCLIWYFSYSYESPSTTSLNNNGVETTASSFQDGKPKSYKSTKAEAAYTTEDDKDYSKALEEMRRRQKENSDKYTAPEDLVDSFLASIQNSTATEQNPQPKKSAAANKFASNKLLVNLSYRVVNENSVGDEWSCNYSITGDALYVGNTLSASVGDTITISATARESDDYPDVGSGSITRTLSYNDIVKGFSTTFTVYVRENNGRYTGNTATINVTITFTPKQ